jgi:uncharacterized protein YqgC (DUF456 family)
MKTNGRKQIAILSFTLVVVMLGFGMVIPIYPYLSGAVIMFIGFLISLVWIRQHGTETTSTGLQPAAD